MRPASEESEVEWTHENTQEDATCAIAASTPTNGHAGDTCGGYGSPTAGGPRNDLQFCRPGRLDDHQYRTDHDQRRRGRRRRALSRYVFHRTGERHADRDRALS